MCDEYIGAAAEYGDVFEVFDCRERGWGQRGFERVPFAGENRDEAIGPQDAVNFCKRGAIERVEFGPGTDLAAPRRVRGNFIHRPIRQGQTARVPVKNLAWFVPVAEVFERVRNGAFIDIPALNQGIAARECAFNGDGARAAHGIEKNVVVFRAGEQGECPSDSGAQRPGAIGTFVRAMARGVVGQAQAQARVPAGVL